MVPADIGAGRCTLNQSVDGPRRIPYQTPRYALWNHHEAAFSKLLQLLPLKHTRNRRYPTTARPLNFLDGRLGTR